MLNDLIAVIEDIDIIHDRAILNSLKNTSDQRE